MTITQNKEIAKFNIGDFVVHIHDCMSDIPQADWDHCAGQENPFSCHAYLNALETSAAVSRETGYDVHHVVVREHSGRIAAAAPTYIKYNSEGEIGMDMGWSMAHDRMCGPYYPKLQVELPFSPVPGARFLVAPEQNTSELYEILLNALSGIVQERNLSSLHVNFISGDERAYLEKADIPVSTGYQFQWESRGQQEFDDFITSLKGSKRQMIKRERRVVKEYGLDFETLTGCNITADVMDQFSHLYVDTYDRYDSKDYLSTAFFQNIRENMADKLLLNTVREKGQLIAATLSFLGSDTVFVAHWGCHKFIKFLHFETTYYKAIDYCFEHGLSKVYGGPGGQHKANRGFLPITTYHGHIFSNKDFEKAVIGGMQKKGEIIRDEQDKLLLDSPYRRVN